MKNTFLPANPRDYNSCMPKTLSRLQVRLVASMYAVVAVISGLLIFNRYLLYVQHPQDVSAASGMYAGGDLLLEAMVLCLFLVPTAVLVFFLRRSESAYTAYAKILLGVSCTAPLSLGLIFIPALSHAYLGDAIIFRLFAIPIFTVVLIVSLYLTRFSRARRLISYALLIEALPLAILIGILFVSAIRHRH